MNSGAGTNSFVEAEGDAFLEFLSKRLDDPSEALTICRIERATLRASARADTFVQPDLMGLNNSECAVRASPDAAVVHCDTEPKQLLFGPGLAGLWRSASRGEAELWSRLSAPAAASELFREAKHMRGTLEALLTAGAVEYAR